MFTTEETVAVSPKMKVFFWGGGQNAMHGLHQP